MTEPACLLRRRTDAEDQPGSSCVALATAIFIDRHGLDSQRGRSVKGRWRKPGVRDHTGLYGTGEREDGHVFGARSAQDSGTLVGCGAGGEHIVNQEYALVGHFLGLPQGKRLAEVLQACRAGESGLRIGIDGTNQVPIGYGALQHGRDAIGKEQGLIKLSLSKAVGVERDRHQEVSVQVCRERSNEQRTQGIRQSHLPAIFK